MGAYQGDRKVMKNEENRARVKEVFAERAEIGYSNCVCVSFIRRRVGGIEDE